MQTTTETPKSPNPLAVKFPDLQATLDVLPWTTEEVPDGTPHFSVMGEIGDTKHIWDKRKEIEVEAARVLFNSLTKKGYTAYHVTGKEGEKDKRMHEFDPEAERMMFVPPVQGG